MDTSLLLASRLAPFHSKHYLHLRNSARRRFHHYVQGKISRMRHMRVTEKSY